MRDYDAEVMSIVRVARGQYAREIENGIDHPDFEEIVRRLTKRSPMNCAGNLFDDVIKEANRQRQERKHQKENWPYREDDPFPTYFGGRTRRRRFR